MNGLMWIVVNPEAVGKNLSPLLSSSWACWGLGLRPPPPSTFLTGTPSGPRPFPNHSLFLPHLPLAEKHGPCEAHRAPGKVMLEEGGGSR